MSSQHLETWALTSAVEHQQAHPLLCWERSCSHPTLCCRSSSFLIPKALLGCCVVVIVITTCLFCFVSTSSAYLSKEMPYPKRPFIVDIWDPCVLCVLERLPNGTTQATTHLSKTQPVLQTLVAVSYTHLTLPTTGSLCRSRWSPYH